MINIEQDSPTCCFPPFCPNRNVNIYATGRTDLWVLNDIIWFYLISFDFIWFYLISFVWLYLFDFIWFILSDLICFVFWFDFIWFDLIWFDLFDLFDFIWFSFIFFVLFYFLVFPYLFFILQTCIDTGETEKPKPRKTLEKDWTGSTSPARNLWS